MLGLSRVDVTEAPARSGSGHCDGGREASEARVRKEDVGSWRHSQQAVNKRGWMVLAMSLLA